MESTETIDRLNAEAWQKRMDEPEAAVALATDAGDRARAAEYPAGVGWSLLTIGFCASLRGENTVALERLEEALSHLVGAEDRTGEAVAQGEIGWVLTSVGDYHGALERFL